MGWVKGSDRNFKADDDVYRLTPRSVSKFLILARFLEEPLPRY